MISVGNRYFIQDRNNFFEDWCLSNTVTFSSPTDANSNNFWNAVIVYNWESAESPKEQSQYVKQIT
jgi:hypothetical protein